MQIAINQLQDGKYLVFINKPELMKNEEFSEQVKKSFNILSPYTADLYSHGQHPQIEKIKSAYTKDDLEQKLETEMYFIFG